MGGPSISIVDSIGFPKSAPNQFKCDGLASHQHFQAYSKRKPILLVIYNCLTLPLMLLPYPGLIILNAWYGKFVTDNSRRHERAKVIDVTVPLQCLVKDSKLILTETSKVCAFYIYIQQIAAT